MTDDGMALEGYIHYVANGTTARFRGLWTPLPDGRVDVFAVIAIDGAGEHMGLVHKLGEVDPGDVEIGMRVQAVWKEPAEREGSITDIRYFRPVAPDATIEAEIVAVKPVELTSVSAGSFPGRIPLDYAYTAGIGGRRFYEDLAAGKVSTTECPGCGLKLLPPSGFCELCLRTLDVDAAAVAVDPDTGVVAAATLVFEDRKGRLLPEPVWVVQVTFPGASGSLFGGLDADPGVAVAPGAPVRPVATAEVGPEHVRFELR